MATSNWTFKSKHAFHKLVSELNKTNKTQFEEIELERLPQTNLPGSNHVLSPHHELKLANDIAYLACVNDGSAAISAVCLEETVQGLTVRIASNERPAEKTIAGLQVILEEASMYAQRRKSREEFVDQVFEKIFSLSTVRIIQRICPSWLSQKEPCLVNSNCSAKRLDKKWIKGKGSLALRLKPIITQLGPLQSRFPATYTAIIELERLLNAVESVDSDHSRLEEYMRAIILSAFDTWRLDVHQSLENKLHASGLSEIAAKKEIRQIDKLARYRGICRNLAKICRQPEYRALFSQISIVLPQQFGSCRPLRGNVRCRVHAEVQLVMHYESQPIHPAPRAIGCSKSACYLCHLLISLLGSYTLSGSHGRLYPKWTVPEEVRMSWQRANTLETAMSHMIANISDRLAASKGRKNGDPVIESRAQSLLSGTSTITQLSAHDSLLAAQTTSFSAGALSIPDTPRSHEQPGRSQGEAPSEHRSAPLLASIVRLSGQDLPYKRQISGDMPLLDLNLGHFCLNLDLTEISLGQLSVRKAIAQDTMNLFEASELPTTSEGRLISCKASQNWLKFQILCFGHLEVDVEVIWGQSKKQ